MSDLIGNPEDRFSHNEAQISEQSALSPPNRGLIMITCPFDLYPLAPHFYIAKLGFTGVFIIFLFLLLKHRLWVLVRTASVRRF